MRVALVGCGSIGNRHTNNLVALGCDVGRFDVVANDHISPASDLRMHEWDAVVIATPWRTHLPYVEAAITSGTPFFCEKPLGSLDQLPRWREIAALDLPVHQVGYQLRFNAQYRAMRGLVPRPTAGRFVCRFNMDTWPGKSYGPALLEASHELDLALDSGLSPADVELRDGMTYYREWNIANLVAAARVRVLMPEMLGDQMYRDELEHFIARVRGERDLGPACDLPQALKVLEVCAQVEQMARVRA